MEIFAEEGKERHALDRTGMHIAGIIAVLGLVISAAAILTGHSVTGTILGSAEVSALVTAFLAARKSTVVTSTPKKLGPRN